MSCIPLTPTSTECQHFQVRHFVISGTVTALTESAGAVHLSIKTGPGIVNTIGFAGVDLCDLPKWLAVGVDVEFNSETNRITLLQNEGI